jgi:hypothetical protein
MAQMIECLPNKHKVLSSKPEYQNRERKRQTDRIKQRRLWSGKLQSFLYPQFHTLVFIEGFLYS